MEEGAEAEDYAMLFAVAAPRVRKSKSHLSCNAQRQRTDKVTFQSNLAESVMVH
jgi:hypothetical protein